ncbi:MAG TPA: hypothetical protein VJS18_07855 [Paraburkholderia sp.]|nr:hypothetical protein [Paraburkholderia sp.]
MIGSIETEHVNLASHLRFNLVQRARAARYMQERHATEWAWVPMTEATCVNERPTKIAAWQALGAIVLVLGSCANVDGLMREVRREVRHALETKAPDGAMPNAAASR